MTPHEQILARAAVDKAFFASFFFNSDGFLVDGIVPRFGRRGLDVVDEGEPQTAIIFPRGHIKTTLITVIRTVWRVLHEECYISIVTATDGLKKDLSNIFDAIFESNELLREFYGNQKTRGDETWNQTTKQLANDSTIKIFTQGQTMRGTKDHKGRRPVEIILDDIETTKQAKSELQTGELIRWFLSEVRPALDQTRGRIILVGNIISRMAMTNQIATGKDHYGQPSRMKGWRVLRYSAVNFEARRILWEGHAKYTVEHFERLRDELGQAFWSEYQNVPIDEVDAPFTEGALRRFQLLPEIPLRWFATVDVAYTKNKSSDATAWAVGPTDWENTLWIREARKRKLDLEERIDLLFDIHRRYGPLGLHTIHVEANPDFIDAVNREQGRRKRRDVTYRHFHVEPLKHGGRSKTDRILQLRPELPFIQWHEDDTAEARAELIAWSPLSTVDDLGDAVAYLREVAEACSDRPHNIHAPVEVPEIVREMIRAKYKNQENPYNFETTKPKRY